MKKIIELVLVGCIALSMTACGEKKIQEESASAENKQAVIEEAKGYFASEEFQGYVALYESTFGKEAKSPEIVNALTFQYDDVEGYALDLILFNIKADAAVEIDGEIFGADAIQFIVDRKNRKVYDSMAYMNEMANFDGTFHSAEEVIIGFLNSNVLSQNADSYLWSEMETSTRFTKDDIKEINAAVFE